MKLIALPFLVVALGTICVSARADEPNLGPSVVIETGLMSLGSRDSMIVHAKERLGATSHLTVQFFSQGEDEDPLLEGNAVVALRMPGTVSLPYSAVGTSAPLAVVWARITWAQELPPTGPVPSSQAFITIEHAYQPTAALTTAQVEGSCILKAGPPISGGGRDSKCSGTLVVPDDYNQ